MRFMHILIAEDDPVSAKLLSTIVKDYGDVRVVENGQEAFDAYCEAHEEGWCFDLILLDIIMPQVDGQGALEAIREFEETHGIEPHEGVKVIMVTALTDSLNLYQAHRNYSVDYLPKPINRESVIKAMCKLELIAPGTN
jgi:two-component system, chemotaxis family, chemotaxis protein CheY